MTDAVAYLILSCDSALGGCSPVACALLRTCLHAITSFLFPSRSYRSHNPPPVRPISSDVHRRLHPHAPRIRPVSPCEPHFISFHISPCTPFLFVGAAARLFISILTTRRILCTNRDEFLDRPTEDAHFHAFGEALAPGAEPPVLAGRDLQAGGSWFGVNRAGRVALL